MKEGTLRGGGRKGRGIRQLEGRSENRDTVINPGRKPSLPIKRGADLEEAKSDQTF